MEVVLMSIKPEYAEAILVRGKLIEFRRRRPNLPVGTRIVIYASGNVRRVVGVCEVAGVESGTPLSMWRRFRLEAGGTRRTFLDYFEGSELAYGIRLRKPRRVRAPRPLPIGLRAPETYLFLRRDNPMHRPLLRLASQN